jgi:hypothetical protein
MSLHRFTVGERVSVTRTRTHIALAGAYKVIALLPGDGARSYRVKSEGEPYERIVTEDRLEAAAPL